MRILRRARLHGAAAGIAAAPGRGADRPSVRGPLRARHPGRGGPGGPLLLPEDVPGAGGAPVQRKRGRARLGKEPGPLPGDGGATAPIRLPSAAEGRPGRGRDRPRPPPGRPGGDGAPAPGPRQRHGRPYGHGPEAGRPHSAPAQRGQGRDPDVPGRRASALPAGQHQRPVGRQPEPAPAGGHGGPHSHKSPGGGPYRCLCRQA